MKEVLDALSLIPSQAWYLFAGFIGLLSLLYFFKPNQKKFSRKNLQLILQQIKQTEKLDPIHGTLELHKIFVSSIATLFQKNLREHTAVELIKIVIDRLPNSDQIWRVHRLRNRIAHETDTKVSVTQFQLSQKDIIRALKFLTK